MDVNSVMLQSHSSQLVFLLLDSSLATIVDVAVYDGNDLTPDIWDPGLTCRCQMRLVQNLCTCLCNLAEMVYLLMMQELPMLKSVLYLKVSILSQFLTIPDFDTVVSSGYACKSRCMIPKLILHVITVHQIIPPCRCEITGPTHVPADPFNTSLHSIMSPLTFYTVTTCQIMFGVIPVLLVMLIRTAFYNTSLYSLRVTRYTCF